jgi:hypothetical protein
MDLVQTELLQVADLSMNTRTRDVRRGGYIYPSVRQRVRPSELPFAAFGSGSRAPRNHAWRLGGKTFLVTTICLMCISAT